MSFAEKARDAWRASFPAFLVSLAFSLVNGTFFGAFFEEFAFSYPVILIALPGLMDLRGNVFGALASRFTTLLYLGEMKPSLRDENVLKGVSLGLSLSMLPLVVLLAVGVANVGITESLPSVLIIFASTVIVSALLGWVTAAATVIPFRRGMDPDSVATPLVVTFGDLLTIPTLAAFVLIHELLHGVMYALAAVAAIMLAVFLRYGISGRTFIESGAVLTALAAMEAISGSMLHASSECIYRAFILSVLYPSVLASLGNYGSVVGAKTSTRLHLGELSFADRDTLETIASLATTAVPLSLIMYLSAAFICVSLGKPATLVLSFFLLYPLIAIAVMFVAFAVAFIAHRFRLDPDNVTVPAITTIADLIGTALIVMLAAQ